MTEKLSAPLTVIGMLLIAGALVAPLLVGEIHSSIPYIYAGGAALLLLGRLFYTYYGKNVRLKRLYRLETWSALVFCVAACFFFYNPHSLRDVIAFSLAGALIQIYTSLMIPRERAKSQDNEA